MTFRLLAVLLLGSISAVADLYTIGPDSNNIPTILVDVTTPTGLFMLGDDSLAFNGGLTLNSATGTFYAIANDSLGNSYLDSFTLGGPGTLKQIASLGTGFTSGLVYDPADGNLYGLNNDFSVTGNTYFDRITLAGAVTQLVDLGQGFEGFATGGLTYDPSNGLFYAMGADSNGISRQFNSISLSGSVVPIAALGDGSTQYNGGIFYDPAIGLFDSVSTNSVGNSSLGRLMSDGTVLQFDGGQLGQGVDNVGLTGNVTITATPEPALGGVVGLSLLALLFLRFEAQRRRVDAVAGARGARTVRKNMA